MWECKLVEIKGEKGKKKKDKFLKGKDQLVFISAILQSSIIFPN